MTREYYLAHREAILERQRAVQNTDSLRQRRREHWHSPAGEKRRVAAAKWAKENRDKRKSGWLRFTYGISLDELNAIIAKQNGRCAICHQEFIRIDFKENRSLWPHLDHDHATGKVRGVLCKKCNLGLGHFRDDIARLQSALAYLQTHKEI